MRGLMHWRHATMVLKMIFFYLRLVSQVTPSSRIYCGMRTENTSNAGLLLILFLVKSTLHFIYVSRIGLNKMLIFYVAMCETTIISVCIIPTSVFRVFPHKGNVEVVTCGEKVIVLM